MSAPPLVTRRHRVIVDEDVAIDLDFECAEDFNPNQGTVPPYNPGPLGGSPNPFRGGNAGAQDLPGNEGADPGRLEHGQHQHQQPHQQQDDWSPADWTWWAANNPGNDGRYYSVEDWKQFLREQDAAERAARTSDQ